jgi:hypothetical protein
VIPFVNFTARVEGHPSDALSRRYEIRGFPTLMILDASGKKVATPDGRDIASFSATIASLEALDSLRARKDAGEVGLEASILLARLQLGSIDFKQAAKQRKALVKPKKFESSQWEADLVEIDALLFNLKLADMFQNAGRDPDKQAELGEKLYVMAKNGRFASGPMTYQYWSQVMLVAKKKKDVKVYEAGYNALHAMFKDNPRAKKVLAEMKAELDAMR